MEEFSDYERAAWVAIQRFEGRRLSQGMNWVGEKAASGITALGQNTTQFLEGHPRADLVFSRGKQFAAKSTQVLGTGLARAGDALPSWGDQAFASTHRTIVRVSRAGLTPRRVVSRHRKHGHEVTKLADLRDLDLEQIDNVRGRAASWYYPAIAALSGAGTGLVISGGQVVTAASAGAAAAPSAGAVMGAFAGDAAIVIGLSSRVVGYVALHYGYDPEDPAEKLFVLAAVNAGTAMSATAKTAAMADISRLTQALVRGQTWAVLNESIVARVSQQVAKTFGFRLTKKGLGKAVPAVGIVVGGTLNWATLESIIDTADVAYRRRFLIEKYPDLADEEPSAWLRNTDADVPEQDDEVLSVVDELAEAGGPDLRSGEFE